MSAAAIVSGGLGSFSSIAQLLLGGLVPGAASLDGIEERIVAAIAADSALVALVAARVYADEAPQECTYPAIVFTCIATVPVVSLAGSSGQDNCRWQFDCWAETFDAARAVGAALVTAIEAAATFKAVRIAGPFSGPVEPDLKLFRRIVEFSTWQ